MGDLVDSMKRAGLDAFNASKPVAVLFGTVISVSPLQINVEQKMTLGKEQLILSRNVTDFGTNVTVNWTSKSALSSHQHGIGTEESNVTTETAGDPSHRHTIAPTNTGSVNLNHTHGIEGTKSIIVHNALKNGDKVILLRVSGGQKFVVMDRVSA